MHVHGDIQLAHLGVGDFDPFLVDLANPSRTNAQAGGSGCGSDIVEDCLEAVEWTPCPVFADFAEQPMFNRIPL